MTEIKSNRFLNALAGKPHDSTPIWMMRQAGRYLPEYRAIRAKKKTFMEFCKSPELACEATLQPILRYGFDAAILFSDILTIPDAMGLGLRFIEGVGPVFDKPLRTGSDVDLIVGYETQKSLEYVSDAIRLIKRELDDTPLIGFSGSPWTLATYMIEGAGSKQFTVIRKMLYQLPELLCKILEINTARIIEYLGLQIEAGVDSVMLFDTWGGVLTEDNYSKYSLLYMSEIIKSIKSKYPDIPIIIYTKGSGLWLKRIAASGANGVGVDWTISLERARRLLGEDITIQGNIDPAALYSKPKEIRKLVKETISSYGDGYRHIFNLGHGIFPDIDPENVKVLVDAVREYGTKN
jgi:uroporphyrinogen decarboxylase